VLDLGARLVDEPAGRVAYFGSNIFDSDGEVDQVEIEVVNTPVRELLACDWLDLLGVVERVPKFRSDEEVFALYDALLDSAGNTLAAFDLVAVI
jgi:hypothetical protein